MSSRDSGHWRHLSRQVARAWENESAMSFGRSAAKYPVVTARRTLQTRFPTLLRLDVTNAQIGKQFFPARKRLVEQCYVIFHKWWSLKNKYFPNRHTVLAAAWSELWGHDWIPKPLTARRTLQTRFPTLLRLDVTNDVNGRCHATTFSRFNFR